MSSSAAARARARRRLHEPGATPTPGVRRRERPSGSHLRVLERPDVRRRRSASRATVVVFGLAVFTIAVIVFQAMIAEQQLRLDALTRDLRMAEVHYDNLRQQRAELLMPARLREEAVMMGMYQGLSAKFADVPAEVVAEVLASTAKMNPLFVDPPLSVASAAVIAKSDPVAGSRP